MGPTSTPWAMRRPLPTRRRRYRCWRWRPRRLRPGPPLPFAPAGRRADGRCSPETDRSRRRICRSSRSPAPPRGPMAMTLLSCPPMSTSVPPWPQFPEDPRAWQVISVIRRAACRTSPRPYPVATRGNPSGGPTASRARARNRSTCSSTRTSVGSRWCQSRLPAPSTAAILAVAAPMSMPRKRQGVFAFGSIWVWVAKGDWAVVADYFTMNCRFLLPGAGSPSDRGARRAASGFARGGAGKGDVAAGGSAARRNAPITVPPPT